MFVVLYDCSDMPPKSQTFLRQKTYSALKENAVKNEVLPIRMMWMMMMIMVIMAMMTVAVIIQLSGVDRDDTR